MSKNIILFADGTGNKGGTGSDTNVFRLYHAIKGGKDGRKQITFYDDGVGTSSHAVARAIGGATGLGFKRNVRNLYEFTGRHYEDGDDIYGFGFSRGAATIRAFVGMVNYCDLVLKNTGDKDAHGNEIILDEAEFQRQINAAMATYVRRGGGFSLGRLWQAIFRPDLEYRRCKVEIEFLGLWDTVAALGFPQLLGLDAIVEFFRRHKFYDYEPTASVKHVFHAVAVDDERRTFWPRIWDETKFGQTKFGHDQHIEQVWFSGVHSNIGGGYPRAGLANIPLDWMIARLEGHRDSIARESRGLVEHDGRGLVLEKSFPDDVLNGVNPYGKLYDSRGGFALLYRFQPRPIAEQCKGRLRVNGAVRIHASVLDRMERRTAGYGPGQLPKQFDEVQTRTTSGPSLFSTTVRSVDLNKPMPAQKKSEWPTIRREIDRVTNCRITLYWWFLMTTIALLLVSLYFWAGELEYGGLGEAWRKADWINWSLGHLADILHYFLPDFFQNIINYGILKQPWWGTGFFGTVVLYYVLRSRFRRWSDAACEKARNWVMGKAR